MSNTTAENIVRANSSNHGHTRNPANACGRNRHPRHYGELLNVANCRFEWNNLPERGSR